MFVLALAPALAFAQQPEPANGLLLIAKPGLTDPNFSQTVVLVTQTPDFQTLGVILNRPTAERHEKTGDTLYFGGPVLRRTLVAVYRSSAPPAAPAFHVLKDIYLTMHPANIDALLAKPGQRYRLYAGFSGWAPRQLESEFMREGWYVAPAREEILFRKDTSGMWNELLEQAQKREAPHARGLEKREAPHVRGLELPLATGDAARAAHCYAELRVPCPLSRPLMRYPN